MQPKDDNWLGLMVLFSLYGCIFVAGIIGKLTHEFLVYCSNSLVFAYGFEFGVVLFIIFVIVLNLWIFYRCCFLMQRSKTHA